MYYFILLFSFIYASVDAQGIVKRVMDADESFVEEGLVRYKHYLECDHQHTYTGVVFTYDIHCIQLEGEDKKILTIHYEKNGFDKYIVTSCKLEDVVNSVFPPEQKETLNDEDKPDMKKRPTVSHLKYITEDGKCYVRKYEFVNGASKGDKRYTPEEIKCAGNPEWSKHGEVARFSNCIVPAIPIAKIVKIIHTDKAEWYPGKVGVDKAVGHEELLHCKYDKFSDSSDLRCVKVDGVEDFWVLMTFSGITVDRYTVTSCKEDDIVNGIFPPRFTLAHRSPGDGIHPYRFAQVDGKCYERQYHTGMYTITFNSMKEIPCPSYPDEWTNPTMGFARQWGHCTGKLSKQGSGQESHANVEENTALESKNVGHKEGEHKEGDQKEETAKNVDSKDKPQVDAGNKQPETKDEPQEKGNKQPETKDKQHEEEKKQPDSKQATTKS